MQIVNALIRGLFTRLVKKTATQQCMVLWDCYVTAEGEGWSVERWSVEVVNETITNGDPDASTPTHIVRTINPSRVIDYSEDHRDKEVSLLFSTE